MPTISALALRLRGMALLAAVQHAAFSRRTGARVTLEALTGHVVVHDCPVWGRDNDRVLRILRPNAVVTVQGCTSSLSGFTVTVHEPVACDVQARVLSMAFIAVLIALGLVGARYLLPVWWGEWDLGSP